MSEAACDCCRYPVMDSDPFLANIRGLSEYKELRQAAIACRKNSVHECKSGEAFIRVTRRSEFSATFGRPECQMNQMHDALFDAFPIFVLTELKPVVHSRCLGPQYEIGLPRR